MTFTVTSPVAGERWGFGGNHMVRWTPSDDPTVVAYAVTVVPVTMPPALVPAETLQALVHLNGSHVAHVEARDRSGTTVDTATSEQFVLGGSIEHAIDKVELRLNMADASGTSNLTRPPRSQYPVDDDPRATSFELRTLRLPVGAMPIAAWYTPLDNMAALLAFSTIELLIVDGKIMVRAAGYGRGDRARLGIEVHVLYRSRRGGGNGSGSGPTASRVTTRDRKPSGGLR